MANRSGTTPAPEEQPAPSPERGDDLERVVQALRGLRYGEVRAIVHDGVIVQIERMEKTRLR
jgi:hypothetical protein